MKIAVVGAGNVGCAVAADLTHKHHEVALIKTTKVTHNENFEFMKNHRGLIEVWQKGDPFSANIATVTDDMRTVADAELIYVTTVTSQHEKLIKKLRPHLRDGQIVVLTPGYISTAYFLKHCHGKDITIIESLSSSIDCRLGEPGHVRIGSRNRQNLVGVFPKSNLKKVEPKLASLQYNYKYLNSVIEAGLHNPNLICHTIGAVMGAPRMEKTTGEYCMYWETFTPSVWNALECLDREKLGVLKKLGLPKMTFAEAFKQEVNPTSEKTGKEVFYEFADSPTRAKGPFTLDSRYVTEDVPQGLVMLESFGKYLNVPTPICTALIEMSSGMLGQELRADGRTVETLGAANLNQIIKADKLDAERFDEAVPGNYKSKGEMDSHDRLARALGCDSYEIPKRMWEQMQLNHKRIKAAKSDRDQTSGK